MAEKRVLTIYTDGGVWQKSRSEQGGAFARRIIHPDGHIFNEYVEVVYPSDIGATTVTNNNTELVGVLRAVQIARVLSDRDLFDEYRICSDSGNALGWVFWNYKMKEVPERLETMVYETRAGLKKLHPHEDDGMFDEVTKTPVRWTLLAGHPTRKDFAQGYRVKGSKKFPISEHNVWCDRACGKAMMEAFGDA